MPVLGADEDSEVYASNIRDYASSLHDIIVTLNSRQLGHITQAIFWKARDGRPPDTGVTITSDSIKRKVWTPRDGTNLEWCRNYLAALEKKGKKLVIQSEHCIVGTKGHAICAAVNAAVQEWAETSLRPVQYLSTGQSNLIEMYSALEAEVENPHDPTTGFKNDLMASLRIAEKVSVDY